MISPSAANSFEGGKLTKLASATFICYISIPKQSGISQRR